jgi:DNA topoisomerase VI subunit B
MHINTATHRIQSNIETTTYTAHMEMNAVAFRALTSNVYKDPPKAIVRELLCNARDSHKEAGNEAPIRLHLPTALAPQLEIQDYGTGMSHTMVTELYINFFQSDKRNNSIATGGFGAGSKTPYAYGDQFTVVSIHGGTKRTYSMHVNEGGLPVCILVATEITHEHTGVTVSLPIRAVDFDKFNRAAQTVVPYLDHPVTANTIIQQMTTGQSLHCRQG